MRMKTYNKRRKMKTREEERIKYFMKRYRLKRRDILKNTFFINSKYGKVKVYVCVYEKAKKEYDDYMSACIARAYKPLRESIFYDIKSPFGELEHPSMIKNENIVNKNKHNKSKIKYTLNDDFTISFKEENNENQNTK